MKKKKFKLGSFLFDFHVDNKIPPGLVVFQTNIDTALLDTKTGRSNSISDYRRTWRRNIKISTN